MQVFLHYPRLLRRRRSLASKHPRCLLFGSFVVDGVVSYGSAASHSSGCPFSSPFMSFPLSSLSSRAAKGSECTPAMWWWSVIYGARLSNFQFSAPVFPGYYISQFLSFRPSLPDLLFKVADVFFFLFSSLTFASLSLLFSRLFPGFPRFSRFPAFP